MAADEIYEPRVRCEAGAMGAAALWEAQQSHDRCALSVSRIAERVSRKAMTAGQRAWATRNDCGDLGPTGPPVRFRPASAFFGQRRQRPAGKSCPRGTTVVLAHNAASWGRAGIRLMMQASAKWANRCARLRVSRV